MNLDFEEDVIDVVEQVNSALGDALQVSTTRWAQRPSKNGPPDASLAFFVDGKRKDDDVFLKVSNHRYPVAVKKDVTRARDIALRVGRTLGQHIVAPIHEGKFGDRTYAAFNRLRPLSDYKVPRYFQRSDACRKVVPWLVELAQATRRDCEDPADYEQFFCAPLRSLSQSERVSENVARLAGRCLGYVVDQRPQLFTSFQHGDFWIGNILFERKFMSAINPTVGDFSVIDWGTARLDGYPCIDLARFCSSINRIGSVRNDEMVGSYLERLQISKFEMTVYCLLSLGQLEAELEYFKDEDYLRLCERVVEFLEAHAETV